MEVARALEKKLKGLAERLLGLSGKRCMAI